MYVRLWTVHRGFTLIELLVVIAIIGVLATVVLASLNGSRVKARNATVLAQMEEYRKALELHYIDTGEYPTAAAVSQYDNQYCFGDGMSNLGPGGSGDCMGGLTSNYNSTNASRVTTALAPYISAFPTFEHVNGYASPAFSNCVTTDVPPRINDDNPCGAEYFSLYFALEGIDQECGKAAQSYNDSNGNTVCRLMMQ